MAPEKGHSSSKNADKALLLQQNQRGQMTVRSVQIMHVFTPERAEHPVRFPQIRHSSAQWSHCQLHLTHTHTYTEYSKSSV